MKQETVTKLNSMLKLLNEDSVSIKDIKKFLAFVTKIIENTKEEFNTLSKENVNKITKSLILIEKLKEEIEQDNSNKSSTLNKTIKESIDFINERITSLRRDFDKDLNETKKLLKEVKTIKTTPGKDGEPGKDANEDSIVERLVSKIPKVEPYILLGANIVNEINDLPIESDLQIDASHIKNLPKIVQNQIGGVVARNIYQMGDVVLTSLANNHVLKWNSTNNRWENGAGGGGGGSWGSITGTLSDQTDLQSALDGKANTALSNLSSVAINTSLLLGTSDGGALGSTTKMWSDLFLASGGVINWDNGDLTLTHSSNTLTLAGGKMVIGSGYTSGADGDLSVGRGTDGAIYFGSTGSGNIYYSGSNFTFNGNPIIVTSTSGGTFGGSINGAGTTTIDNVSGARIYSFNNAGTLTNLIQTNGDSYLNGGGLSVGGTLNADILGYNTTRAVFGERRVYINELTDALWKADKRFTVTQSGAGTLSSLFDAGFETNLTVPVSTTNIININIANQSGVPAGGVTYPEGYIYVHFYYTNNNYSALTIRVQANGVWYALATPTDISIDGVNKVLEFAVPGANYLTDIEMTVTTNGSDQVLITGLNYIPTRWTSELESPFFDKNLSDNTLIGNYTTFKNTSNVITARINSNDDWYMGVGGSGGKFGIGTSTPGTYHLNVVGNILGNSIYTNSGSIFGSLGIAYLRANTTDPTHINDTGSGDVNICVGGGDLGVGEQYPTNRLHIKALSATTSYNLLNIDGGAVGFSGANDTGAYSLIFSGCSYQTSIVQNIGAKIEMAKENTWNYADTPTGIKGSLKFYTSAGTPNSPTLTNWMTLTSAGNLGIGNAITPLAKLDARYDATISATTPGTTAYGTIHLVPTTGTDGNSVGISFGANNSGAVSTTSQAGIYVQSSSAYGTRMHFATSNNFGTGATNRMSLMEDGALRIFSLDTDATAPTTSGTTRMVITDANGQLSFANIPAGGGDVSKVGTPANNQMAVWTGDGTLEGTSDFTYDGTSLNLITGKNFQIAGATILSDSAGTTTLQNIDALDATTEATIESAIDTLTNVTLNTPTIDEAVISGTPDSAGELGRDTTQTTLNYYDNGMLGTIPRVIAAGVGTQTFVDSVATDQDYTSLITLPANSLFTNKMYRVTLTFEMISGVSTNTMIAYLKLGSTKVFTQTAQNFLNSTTVSFTLQFLISGRAAASASSAVTTAAIVGMGANFNGGNITNQPVNLATNGTLAITPGVTWSGTGSTESLELQAWLIEELN